MEQKLMKIVTMVILSLALSACGKRPQVVRGIQVQSSIENQEVMVHLRANLDLGNLSFPAVSLPILHPRGQTPIGSVDLLPILGGQNQIAINLNLSQLADLQAIIATLPNGNPIPLIAQNPTVVISLGGGAELYVTASNTVTAIGVAIPIKTFDGIGSAVGGINLFPIFNIDKVVGAAGIFTSSRSGQNGFALIADISQYLKLPASQEEVKLEYGSQIPSKSKEDKINSMLFELNKKGNRLKLH